MSEKFKPDANNESVVRGVGGGDTHQESDRTVFRESASANSGKDEYSEKNKSIDATRIKRAEGAVHALSKDSAKHIGNNKRQQNANQEQTRINTRIQPGINRGKYNERSAVDHLRENSEIKSPSQGSVRRVLKDRFTLEKVIGVGGMGVVYKAVDKLKVEARDREPFVAIKVLSEEFKTHPESFIALQRESRKTQRIAHPNVVKVYDFDRDGETVFMTMEYMEGVPLDHLIKQYSATGLPREEVWTILNGLCSALMYAHAENIVHSDFKPGNIFVTDGGVPKIFDFGIARAVANVDRLSGKSGDKTVFDAGSLGALTPAYASMEMLMGKEPDVRDDVYALGCIAYELLTGSHPFNRIPADEASKKKLKPKKVSGIKNRQWRAIEKSLMFRREDRLASVEEFYNLIQPKKKSFSYVFPVLLIITAIGISTYFIFVRQAEDRHDDSADVGAIKYKIQYDMYKKKIMSLLQSALFTQAWEDSMWEQVSGMTELMHNKPDTWLRSERIKVYDLYVKNYNKAVSESHYVRASMILSNAYRYTENTSYLDSLKNSLEKLMEATRSRQQAKQEELMHEQDLREKNSQKTTKDNYLFGLALKNVNQQLECQSSLSMREFSIAIDKLRSINLKKYMRIENQIVTTLTGCIENVAKNQPERAQEDKRYALRIFPNSSVIKAISITPRDACNRSIAGLGARGERAVCRDRIRGGGMGPALVVIPGNGDIKTFAIGKYEISVNEINDFCNRTAKCNPLNQSDVALPAVDIDINTAKSYLTWLSRMTREKYRLPTRKEWLYAARANGNYRDPNRNCALNSRGIEKGGSLVRANTGAQNAWGLVNYLGNAREWVYDKSHNLEAVGGSFQDSMDNCNVNTVVPQSGRPDPATGFRVVREVTR